jgi:antitoxin component of MazEF toxin-antitoxin module
MGKLSNNRSEKFMTGTQIFTVNELAGFTLTPEWLQQIGVKAGDQIEIIVNQHSLTVRPHDEEAEEDARLETMMDSIMDRHDNLFRKLAEGVK